MSESNQTTELSLPNGEVAWTYETLPPQRVMFDRISSAMHGLSVDVVLNVSLNIFANAVLQRNPTKEEALLIFDELISKARKRVIEEAERINASRDE